MTRETAVLLPHGWLFPMLGVKNLGILFPLELMDQQELELNPLYSRSDSPRRCSAPLRLSQSSQRMLLHQDVSQRSRQGEWGFMENLYESAHAKSMPETRGGVVIYIRSSAPAHGYPSSRSIPNCQPFVCNPSAYQSARGWQLAVRVESRKGFQRWPVRDWSERDDFFHRLSALSLSRVRGDNLNPTTRDCEIETG